MRFLWNKLFLLKTLARSQAQRKAFKLWLLFWQKDYYLSCVEIQSISFLWWQCEKSAIYPSVETSKRLSCPEKSAQQDQQHIWSLTIPCPHVQSVSVCSLTSVLLSSFLSVLEFKSLSSCADRRTPLIHSWLFEVTRTVHFITSDTSHEDCKRTRGRLINNIVEAETNQENAKKNFYSSFGSQGWRFSSTTTILVWREEYQRRLWVKCNKRHKLSRQREKSSSKSSRSASAHKAFVHHHHLLRQRSILTLTLHHFIRTLHSVNSTSKYSFIRLRSHFHLRLTALTAKTTFRGISSSRHSLELFCSTIKRLIVHLHFLILDSRRVVRWVLRLRKCMKPFTCRRWVVTHVLLSRSIVNEVLCVSIFSSVSSVQRFFIIDRLLQKKDISVQSELVPQLLLQPCSLSMQGKRLPRRQRKDTHCSNRESQENLSFKSRQKRTFIEKREPRRFLTYFFSSSSGTIVLLLWSWSKFFALSSHSSSLLLCHFG